MKCVVLVLVLALCGGDVTYFCDQNIKKTKTKRVLIFYPFFFSGPKQKIKNPSRFRIFHGSFLISWQDLQPVGTKTPLKNQKSCQDSGCRAARLVRITLRAIVIEPKIEPENRKYTQTPEYTQGGIFGYYRISTLLSGALFWASDNRVEIALSDNPIFGFSVSITLALRRPFLIVEK